MFCQHESSKSKKKMILFECFTSHHCFYIIYNDLSGTGRFLLNKIFAPQLASIATQPEPPVQGPPSQISSSQTSFSLPATVCYEADGKYHIREWQSSARCIKYLKVFSLFSSSGEEKLTLEHF